MRKLGIIGLSVATLLVTAAVALAAAPAVVTLTGSVTASGPAKNGAVKLDFAVNEDSQSTFDTIKLTIPNGVKLSGKGFKTCSDDQINQVGEQSCPAGSKVGSGTARAVVPGPSPTVLNFTLNIFVAGTNQLTLSLIQRASVEEDPGAIQIAFPAQLSGQFVTATVPEQVRSPIPGLFASVTNVGVAVGPAKSFVRKPKYAFRKKKGKKKKVRVKVGTKKVPVYVATINGCPGGSRSYGVDLHLISNPNPPAQENIGATATGPCSTR